jgi:hypothetical protein
MIRHESATPTRTVQSKEAQPAIATRPLPLTIGLMSLAMYVIVSSFLGLALLPTASLETVLRLWRISLMADTVFVVGSVCVGWLTCHLAIRSRVLALPVGYGLSYFVYLLAFLSIGFPRIVDSGAPGLVFVYGQVGLIFTAIAPLLWRSVAGDPSAGQVAVGYAWLPTSDDASRSS